MQIGVETSKAVDQRRVFVVDHDESHARVTVSCCMMNRNHELATLKKRMRRDLTGLSLTCCCLAWRS